MKVTAHVEIAGQGIPYEEVFPLYKRLGADGVELVIRANTALNLESTDADFLRVRRMAEDNGLAISGLTSGFSWSLPMTSDHEDVRIAGEKAMERVLEGAALLGTDSVLIAPGYASTIFITPSETIDPKIARERAVEGVKKAAAYAAKVGVCVNPEVIWGGMLRSAPEMKAFMDEINMPAAGFYMDTGNVFPEGDPEGWIRTMGKHTRRVHIKDYNPDKPGLDAFCRLGEGRVDYKAVMQALKEVGYDGWLGAEHHVGRTEEEAAYSLKFIRRLANGEIA